MSKPTLESFLQDVASHQLVVGQDDGLFRHLSLAKPDTVNLHFNIITWPGYLCIEGDMGCYVFSRLDDMFAFFRSAGAEEIGINPSYWEEKVRAESIFGGGVREWDADRARAEVQERFDEWQQDNREAPVMDASDIDELREKINSLKLLADEQWEFITAVNNWDEDDALGFDLQDFWECRPESYTYHYLWCCYAIVWAIRQYDEYKAQPEEAATPRCRHTIDMLGEQTL